MRQTPESSDNEILSVDTNASAEIPIENFIKFGTRLYICSHPNCGLQFRRENALDRHEYTHTSVKKYNCNKCDRSYISKYHLKRHIQTSHDDSLIDEKIKCLEESCPLEFRNVRAMKSHHTQSHLRPKLVYKCPHCDKAFQRKFQVRLHEAQEHNGTYPYKCETCGKESINLKKYARHLSSHESYECTICGIFLKKWSKLVHHQQTMHVNQCEICKKTFSRKSNYTAHTKTHLEKTKIFECTVDGCKKFYYHSKYLKAHIRDKHNDRTWECYRCHQIICTKQKLAYHIERCDEYHRQLLKMKKGRKIPKEIIGPRTRNERGIDSKKNKTTAALLTGVVADSFVEKMVIIGRGNKVTLSNIVTTQEDETYLED